MHYTCAFLLSILLLGALAKVDGDQSDKMISASKVPQKDHEKNLAYPGKATDESVLQLRTAEMLDASSVKANYPNTTGTVDTLKNTSSKVFPEPSRVGGARVSRTTKTGRPEPMLTGTTTITSSQSGTLASIVTIVTIDPTRTKISSCIYGCSVITLATQGEAAKATVITALPETLPCSRSACPPCGCTSKTISVFGSPVITTITPPASQVFVTAPFTITYITVTTTVTSCTATTCPRPAIVTVLSTSTITSTRSQSYTTLTQYSTVRITPRSQVPDEAYALGHDPNEPPGSFLATIGYPRHGEDSILRGAKLSSINHDKWGWKGICRWNFMASHQEPTRTQDSNDHGVEIYTCESSAMAKLPPTATITTTTVTVERPLTINHSQVGSICSTYVICNPQQFSCPTQVKSFPQLQKFIQQLQSSEPKITSLEMEGIILQNLPPPRAVPVHDNSGSLSKDKKGHEPLAPLIKGDKPDDHIIGDHSVPSASKQSQVVNHVDPLQAQHPTGASLAPTGGVTMGRKIETAGDHDSKDTTGEKEEVVQGASSRNSGASLWGISTLGAACTLLSSLLLSLLR